MLVSHRKKFIFTKTVKTAGTSVESFFEKWCMPEGEWKQVHGRKEYVSDAGIVGERTGQLKDAQWYNHMSAYNIRKHLGSDMWDEYLKFTVVRNPFEKLVSGFFMFQKDKISAGNEVKCFRTWLRNFGTLVMNNIDLVKAQHIPHYVKPIELALIDRDKYLINGKTCVDYFIRYESLVSDIDFVCKQVGIHFETCELPEFKKGIRHHKIPVQEYYDAQCIDLVLELYAWEISRFCYSLAA